MSQPLSSRFLKIFNDLPPEAQQMLLEKSLGDMLDQLSPEAAKKVTASALKIKTKHQNVPKLDLRRKRKEVGGLLEVLHRESKMFMFQDRMSREEIFSEIMGSLTGWLNDIWSTFYEHHMQYMHAHACLMFVADALSRLDSAPNPAGCRCDLMNLPVRVDVIDKTGKRVTKLRVRGPQNLDRLLLWIWRDLLVCIIAKGTKRDKENIPRILGDLERLYGFLVLDRLLIGGKKSKSALEEEDEDEDEIFLEDETLSDLEGDDDDDDPFSFFRSEYHSGHWGGKFGDEAVVLRNHALDHLFGIFSVTPSLPLYDTIMGISSNSGPAAAKRATAILNEIAGTTSDTFAAALNIEVGRSNPMKIVQLLDQHSYLLRPRDAVTLQCVAAVLGDSSFHSRGLALLESGLNDTLADIRMAVRGAFTHIEEPAHKKELTDIIKLRSGSAERRERIETWSQAVMSSSGGHGMGHFMAAMMFGIPMMQGMPGFAGMVDDGDEASDLLNFIDLEQTGDADIEDLREEFRPKLKQRFDGWAQLATVMKGGVVTAAKAYGKAVELMPYLRASDVVNEMVNRLGDRPGKRFVAEALESLSSFCKTQRKKLSAARKDKEKQAANKTPPAGTSVGQTGPSTSNPSTSASTPEAGATPTPNPAASANDPPSPGGSPPVVTLPFPFPFLFTAAPPPASPPPAGPSAASSQPAPVPQPDYPPPLEAPFRVFQGMEDVD